MSDPPGHLEGVRPHAADNTVSFSRIFEQVEYDDPGSFSCHLQQLEGHFIRQHAVGEGYELRLPGLRFIQVVIAGAGMREAALEPTPIDQPCPFCHGSTAISYREGLVIHVCTECEAVSAEEDIPGYLSAVPFDPAGLSDRSAEEIRAASRVVAWRQTQFMFDGMCPACSGVVESKLECCPDHDPAGICEHCGTQFAALARFEWEICKNHNVSSPKALAMFHPAVVGFYETHGISTRSSAVDAESVRRIFELMESHAVDLLDDDPPEVEVIVDLEGDEIRLMFDERAAVVDVNR